MNEFTIPVSELDADRRSAFVTRTYVHLAGAISLFALIEMALFKLGYAYAMADWMMGLPGGWLVILGAFMIVAWLASSAAHSAKTAVGQYGALGAYVVAEAIIFIPLLVLADTFAPGAIRSAAWVTLAGFGGLTAFAMITKEDFSFLGKFLKWVGIVALVAIVGSFLFNYTLGTWFAWVMVVVASGSILYTTSNIIHHYSEDSHVAAALELFAGVALMFWYVLRIFMSRD